jgi:hypothetical protein
MKLLLAFNSWSQREYQSLGRKALISVFIASYIYFLVLSSWTVGQQQQRLYSFIRPLLVYWNFNAFFAFGSGIQLKKDQLHTIIFYSDGSRSRWHGFDTIQDKIIDRRFRRYQGIFANIGPTKNSIVWRDFARFVARASDTVMRHPVLIQVVEYQETIKDPLQKTTKPLKKDTRILYAYQVLPEDLK